MLEYKFYPWNFHYIDTIDIYTSVSCVVYTINNNMWKSEWMNGLQVFKALLIVKIVEGCLLSMMVSETLRDFHVQGKKRNGCAFDF